jgi:hypothetical protein
MKMLEVRKESLEELQKYLGLDYVPIAATVENWEEETGGRHGIESLKVEWSDGNQIHSIEANQNLNELVDLFYEPLERVMTFSEAAEKWNLGDSTLREAVRNNRFNDGEIRKSGGTWLITEAAMKRLYGEAGGKNTYIAGLRGSRETRRGR